VQLTSEERRVLGCLVEKERTTPQAYPLTLNSLRLACNQTTARDPVVRYEDRDVETALTSLRAAGLIRIVHSPHNRATKYRHVLGDVLEIGDAGVALLAALMLRGPQTVGELHARTERLHRFEGMSAVQVELEALASNDPPLAVRLERRPGQKDARWTHRLGGPTPTAAVDDETDVADEDDRPATVAPPSPAAGSPDGLADEVRDLRREVNELRAVVDQLREALGD
jgi:uncharacterized protein YceH (UPF0502 family)